MAQKHRTKIVNVPTKIITIPVSKATKEELSKIPVRWDNSRRNRSVQVYCAIAKDDSGRYHSFSFRPEELQKKTNKNNIKGELTSNRGGGFSVISSGFISIDRLFFVYIENKLDTVHDVNTIIKNYQEYIGTNKTIDADWVISCGQDFTYEQPYGHLVMQPHLNGKHIALRKEFADNPKITFYFEKDGVQLFREVQKLLIEKYKVVGDEVRVIKDGRPKHKGFAPWEFQDEFPVSHYSHSDKPTIWSYLRIDNTQDTDKWHGRKPKVRVLPGNFSYMYVGSMYRKEMGIKVESVEQIDKFMERYRKYVRLVLPKQILA